MSPEDERARSGCGPATRKGASSNRDSMAPVADATINLRARLMGFALELQRAGVAMIALALAGWPR